MGQKSCITVVETAFSGFVKACFLVSGELVSSDVELLLPVTPDNF